MEKGDMMTRLRRLAAGRRGQQPHRGRRLAVESLESRTVLSAAPLAVLTEIGATIRAESLRNPVDWDRSPIFAEVGRPFVDAKRNVHGERRERVSDIPAPERLVISISHHFSSETGRPFHVNTPASASPQDWGGAVIPSLAEPLVLFPADRSVFAERLEPSLDGPSPIPAFEPPDDRGLDRQTRFVLFDEAPAVDAVRHDTLYVSSAPGLAAFSSATASAPTDALFTWIGPPGPGGIDSYAHGESPLGTDVVASRGKVSALNPEPRSADGRLGSVWGANDMETSEELAELLERMRSLPEEHGTEGGLVDIRADDLNQTDPVARQAGDLTNLTKLLRRKSSELDAANPIRLDAERRSEWADERVPSGELNRTAGARYASETLAERDAASSGRRDQGPDEGGMIELVAGTLPAEVSWNVSPAPLPLDRKAIQMDAGLGLFQSLEVAAEPMDQVDQSHSVSTPMERDATAEKAALSDGLKDLPVNRGVLIPTVLAVLSLFKRAARRQAQDDSPVA